MAKEETGTSDNLGETTEKTAPESRESEGRATTSGEPNLHQSLVGFLNQISGVDAAAATDADTATATESEESQDSQAEAATDKSIDSDDETESDEDEDKDEKETGEEDEENAADGELPQGVRKTLHDLREQRRQLREEREALKSQLAEVQEQLKAGPSQPAVDRADASVGPAGNTTNPFELSKLQDDAQDHLDQIEEQLLRVKRAPLAVAQWLKSKGVELPTDADGNEDTSAEAMEETCARLRRGLNRTLNRDIPKQREFFHARAQNNQIARQEVEWLDNPKSQEMRIIRGIMEREPGMLKRPDSLRILVRLVEGEKAIQAALKAKAAGQKPLARPAPSAAGRVSSGAPRVNAGRLQMDKARDALVGKNGGRPTAVPMLQQLLNQ